MVTIRAKGISMVMMTNGPISSEFPLAALNRYPMLTAPAAKTVVITKMDRMVKVDRERRVLDSFDM
jgi:hypothetical protein